jgi:hypothetical protein
VTLPPSSGTTGKGGGTETFLDIEVGLGLTMRGLAVARGDAIIGVSVGISEISITVIGFVIPFSLSVQTVPPSTRKYNSLNNWCL